MSQTFPTLYRALWGVLIAQGAMPGAAHAIGPSDCKAGHADSTCAAAVAAAPAPGPSPAPGPPPGPSPSPAPQPLYDGPIAGMPGGGTAYWGFDFQADALGVPGPMPGRDMYINRSNSPINLRFTFKTPPNAQGCGYGCLPRLEFRVGPSWAVRYVPFDVSGGAAVADYAIPAGQYFAWVIGLEQTSNPRLTVTSPDKVTLAQVGLPERMDVASPVPSTTTTCMCWDSSVAQCNYGTRYSNGLMGNWTDDWTYFSVDGWSSCPIKENG